MLERLACSAKMRNGKGARAPFSGYRFFIIALLASVLSYSPRSLVAENDAGSGIRMLFLGDSLTAGFGVDRSDAFPDRVAALAKAKGYSVEVMNGGMSGDTSSGGMRRLNWLLRDPIDIAVIALGANDGLRGLSLEELERNLLDIGKRLREHSPGVELVVAGMKLPLNFGEPYRSRFEAVFPRVARQLDARLIPFLLSGVGGEPHLNLADGIHPSAEGHAIIARTVWQTLEPVLAEQRSRNPKQ